MRALVTARSCSLVKLATPRSRRLAIPKPLSVGGGSTARAAGLMGRVKTFLQSIVAALDIALIDA
jgi:hypothetical protein